MAVVSRRFPAVWALDRLFCPIGTHCAERRAAWLSCQRANSSAVADGGQLLGQATTEGQQQGEEAQRNIPQRANTSRGSGQSGEPVGKRNHL